MIFMSPVIQTIITTFEERGNGKYGKEEVTQLQHALQSAQLAEDVQAPAELIAAALLHDIGHIIESGELPEHNEQNLDDLHEERAYEWLTAHFGRPVADPVRLHVVAKRYLCTKDQSYEKTLSPTSYKSYLDQGGQMNDEEIGTFEREPYHKEALRLRHWDDLAKDQTKSTPAIQHFVPYLEQCLQS
jgi:phosphonate degradation associated HDIG domain protein